MQPVCSAAAIRTAEQAWFASHPGGDLFAPAVAAVVANALDLLDQGPHGFVLVVAGPGNNGEDARRAGEQLAGLGHEVLTWGQGPPFDPYSDLWSHLVLVIDGFTGIGGRAGLPDDLAALAAHCSRRDVPVVAVDLPSGLVADSGQVAGASFRATRTVTFIAAKPAQLLEPAASRCGDLVVADIGVRVPERVATGYQVEDVIAAWPYPGPASDKYSRGVVGLDTGSAHYPGAGMLSTAGALHAGAGMVRQLGPTQVTDRVLDRWPSVVIGEGRVQALVIGSGWGPDVAGDHRSRVAARLAQGVPTVIDADALFALPEQLPPGCLLTPHAGELAKLLGVDRAQVVADPIGQARRAAERWQATVLLKGASQVVLSPGGGPALIAVAGPAWTAQAGSGDTLAGACGTLLAAGLDPARAAVLAASVQAITATQHPGPWPPDQLAERFSATIGQWWLQTRA